MKTALSSNSRPLRRALCTVLIGLAALWAMPRNARAQLYVADNGSGAVGAYNATTGAAINATLIQGLSSPGGLAVAPVPEASPWWMMAGCGAALLGIMLRKKYRFASA